MATKADVPAILRIYAPYVRESTYTFEYEAPSQEEFESRFEKISARHPWIVWEEQGVILGYAYASEAFSRAAYSWDADLSVYLDRNARGLGIGSRLCGCIEELVCCQGYHNLYAIITGENEASRRFHEKRGYVLQGTLEKAGYKMGRWIDVHWYAKRLRGEDDPGARPENFVCDHDARMILKKYSE